MGDLDPGTRDCDRMVILSDRSRIIAIEDLRQIAWAVPIRGVRETWSLVAAGHDTGRGFVFPGNLLGEREQRRKVQCRA